MPSNSSPKASNTTLTSWLRFAKESLPFLALLFSIGSFVLSDWSNREHDRRAEFHQIITDFGKGMVDDTRFAEVKALRASGLLLVLGDREAEPHIAVATMLQQVRRRKIAQHHIDIAYSLPMPSETKSNLLNTHASVAASNGDMGKAMNLHEQSVSILYDGPGNPATISNIVQSHLYFAEMMMTQGSPEFTIRLANRAKNDLAEFPYLSGHNSLRMAADRIISNAEHMIEQKKSMARQSEQPLAPQGHQKSN